MTSGDYEAAAERFAALGNYLDAAAQAKECVYRPATALMAEGRYDEAAEMFATITGYSDANHPAARVPLPERAAGAERRKL